MMMMRKKERKKERDESGKGESLPTLSIYLVPNLEKRINADLERKDYD